MRKIFRLQESAIKNREVIKVFARREMETKYKGSLLGTSWALINPIIMLTIYTVIFSKVFQAKWGTSYMNDNSPIEFAINLFAGLIIFNMFADCASKAHGLILNNPNLVKKIVFPLEVLSISTVIGSLLNASINSIILLILIGFTKGGIHSTVLLYPMIYVPFIFEMIGLTLLISTFAVFVRDIGQIMGSIISLMMFASPVFYPGEALPQSIRWIADVNPIAITISQSRELLIGGSIPSISNYILQTLLALAWCEIAYRLTKKYQHRLGDWV